MWISRKNWEAVVEASDRMLAALSEAEAMLVKAQKHAHLIGIERDGRTLKFTFVRNGEIYQIEACSMMSDNMKEWKEKLLQ